MSTYQPGYCNIGRPQRRQRLQRTCVGFSVSVLYVFGYIAGLVPRPLLIPVFVLVAVGSEWGIQAYTAFCVRLALFGGYNLQSDGGDAGEVSDPAVRRDDQL